MDDVAIDAATHLTAEEPGAGRWPWIQRGDHEILRHCVEVTVEILRLQRPIRNEHPLGPAANRPASLCV